LRKAAATFLVLMICFLLFIVYTLHLGIGRKVSTAVAHLMEISTHKVQVWLDKTPPTPPQNLSGGSAPTIQRAASYYNAAPLTKHTMAPFDSTAGDLLVVCAGTHEDALLTPLDNFNNTWISLAGPTNFGPTNSSGGINLRAQIWYAKNPRVGSNHIFTMEVSKEEALVLSMFVVKGSNPSDPIDVISEIGNDADTRALSPTSPRIATTHSNDLLIGFAKSRFGEVWGAGDGFTFQSSASSDFLVAESGLAATPGSYDAAFAINGPTNWQAAVVAVMPADSLRDTAPITLVWQPSHDNVGVVGYQVERCSGANCEEFTPIGMSEDTSFVDSTPPTPAAYQYRVRAVDEAGNVSKYSNIVIANVGAALN
jgi:hypothetical protein